MISHFKEEHEIFKKHGGFLKTVQAIKLGIHPQDLYAMKSEGVIEPISRGLYRLADMKPFSNPDLITVALKIPKGVISLISALAFYGITTQVPHEVYVALPFGSERPRLQFPPTHYVWISGTAFGSGIETHKIDNIPVRIYSIEKTIADCFKFRNKIGLDVAIEALKLSRQRKRSKVDLLMKYAKVCRVEKIIKPYLEAIL